MNTKRYEPELGQAFFGQPWQGGECPEWMVGLIEGIRSRLGVAGWNEYQREFDPFDNWEDAEVFNKDHKEIGIEVWPYSWNDDIEQKYNFKYKDIEISWYKHLGRGDSINREVSPAEAAEMFDEIAAKLSKWQCKDIC